MDGRALQATAGVRAHGLPATTVEDPFGSDREVFKVQGNVYMPLVVDTLPTSRQPVGPRTFGRLG
ncbi:MmcQ/YjbR family DNA-binding protein [Streptomyces lancefieldiae]|uniref:Uncharacterized protein n=1 Tax=Streptomyces lancefieldiae TaxID=3075520 RepID=A0ABU3AG17_9ACTN|nr:hypothetical protein [Streptomyces sp. DSM 40712]MDT0609116.1 hypothetical protein [Streptomyces sp. DSM 40712]